MATFTHAELVEIAAKWLSNSMKCGAVITEVGGTYSLYGEKPDAMGWRRQDQSVLVECKTSRADFLADRKKLFREKPELGMGRFRLYLAPKDLLSKKDVEGTGWGLLEVVGSKVIMTVKPTPLKRSRKAEMVVLYTALQRVQFRISRPLREVVAWKARDTIINVETEGPCLLQ